ncbi:MAG TPA: sodium-extruding oxaloacetate decarboxylase subunit alpha [Exilispira sp.]|nr:sodium-extruding oxaloacetate decarboxylase subunit alpha [Exilispira sp.]
MPKKIGITDVVLRDAHQSLLATRMLTSDMLPICERLDKVGYHSLEVWGGATFDACIRFLNEDPWKRLRDLKKALPNTKLQMLLRGQNLVGYRHYADDVVDKFVEVAANNGIDIFRIFDALNDIRNMERSIYAVKKVGKHAQGSICYTLTPVHAIDTFVKMAIELEKMGVDSIAIKDMSGLLKPYDAYQLVSEIKKKVKLPIAVHSHTTTGMATTTLIKAIEAGADIVDTAISSLSMGTSHSPTETIVEILKNTEYDTGLDTKLLTEIALYFKEIRKKYVDYESHFTGVDTRILLAQIPGGMLSNLESQLKEQNALDKLDQVLEEIQVVQKDFGYPPLVTPTSQIVGTQAVLNVIFGRYEKLTNESKNLLVGKYGKTPAPVDNVLLMRALSTMNMDKTIQQRPADLLAPELNILHDQLKEKLATNFSDEDLLTYAMFPQVALHFFETRKNGPVKIEPNRKVEKKEENKSDTERKKVKSYTINVNGNDYKVAILSEDEIYIDEIEKEKRFKLKDLNEGNIEKDKEKEIKNSKYEGKKNKENIDEKKNEIRCPVAGTILRLLFKDGDFVKKGDTIAIIESMKMELEIKSPHNGKIEYCTKASDKLEAASIIAYIY